jgi:putative membrane protein
MQRTVFGYLLVTLKGIAMGAADVVPGVSGGTIAFISGIYEELLESIDGLTLNFFKDWRKRGFKKAWIDINGNFLLSLFLGIGISITSLAQLIKWLLEHHPTLLWAFFFGLVLASILYVAKQIRKWNIQNISALILASFLSYYITLAEPFASPESPFYLLFCGFIAIIAMILPGVSGAFILLILGAYQTAIDTINFLIEGLSTGNWALLKSGLVNLTFLGIGAIIGIKIFSKSLNWMFKHHKNLTLSILTGFMVGSLNKIWPWKETLSTRINSEGILVPVLQKSILPSEFNGDPQIVYCLILMIIGFVCILILENLGSQKQNVHAN